MENREVVNAIEQVERERDCHSESVITVFIRCASALRQGHEYVKKLQAMETEQIQFFGDIPNRPPPPLPSNLRRTKC